MQAQNACSTPTRLQGLTPSIGASRAVAATVSAPIPAAVTSCAFTGW